MKIFALYFRINLIKKPEWLDNFRRKYDKAYDIHLTLIQPRYIDEARIGDLKSKVAEFLAKHKLKQEDKTINFNGLVCNQKLDGSYTFMLFAEKSGALPVFQKELRKSLKDFENYVEEANEQYETDFKPHITIGRSVASDLLKEAQSYFQSGYSIKGNLNGLVLPIVKDSSVEEAMDPKNLTMFDL